jgi:diaminopimelate epimerase
VQLVNELESFKVVKEGKRLRYGVYGEKGSNINFVEQLGTDTFAVRTYERGVEDETLSCGTGVTAVALAMSYAGKTTSKHINIRTKGGDLRIKFEGQSGNFSDIYLQGPAELVYKGMIAW